MQFFVVQGIGGVGFIGRIGEIDNPIKPIMPILPMSFVQRTAVCELSTPLRQWVDLLTVGIVFNTHERWISFP